MTTIYNYAPETGEYLHESQAVLDPLEKKPLIPAYATTTAPPATRKNESAVYRDSRWVIAPDFRGQKYWLKGGEEFTITELGETLPVEALTSKPKPTLAALKEKGTQEITIAAFGTRARLSGNADHYKVAGWADKAQRAARVLANTATPDDIAILTQEATQRGKNETPEALAAKQAAKAKVLAMIVAKIDGIESTGTDKLKSARTVSDLRSEISTVIKLLDAIHV